MAEIFDFNKRRAFDLEAARKALPVVRRVTKSAHDQIQVLWEQLNNLSDSAKKAACESEIQEVFREWQEKVSKLGGDAKGMWLVDFDSGDGYYCWRYPEPEIAFFHGYSEGFRGRVPLNPTP